MESDPTVMINANKILNFGSFLLLILLFVIHVIVFDYVNIQPLNITAISIGKSNKIDKKLTNQILFVHLCFLFQLSLFFFFFVDKLGTV